ncbi:hypothetical protein CEXT_743321 [Caerostris extrusa]|uniref:Uncharacterized protein n=1 Tax=Caerostris extrusa TaxID=172846 RepID=A0AAV4VVN7_CAEEX|nr:hypothetical protein CEXT_743321 [Caerostris extrusa]
MEDFSLVFSLNSNCSCECLQSEFSYWKGEGSLGVFQSLGDQLSVTYSTVCLLGAGGLRGDFDGSDGSGISQSSGLPFKGNGNTPHKPGLQKEESAHVIPPNFEPRSQRQIIAPTTPIPLPFQKFSDLSSRPIKVVARGTVHEINQRILADMMAAIHSKRPLPQNPWLTISQSELLNIHPFLHCPYLGLEAPEKIRIV